MGKANAGLDSFEKKAESSNYLKVIRISDQTRSTVQRPDRVARKTGRDVRQERRGHG